MCHTAEERTIINANAKLEHNYPSRAKKSTKSSVCCIISVPSSDHVYVCFPRFGSLSCWCLDAARQRRRKSSLLSWTRIQKSSRNIRSKKTLNLGFKCVFYTAVAIVGIMRVFNACATAKNSSSRTQCCWASTRLGKHRGYSFLSIYANYRRYVTKIYLWTHYDTFCFTGCCCCPPWRPRWEATRNACATSVDAVPSPTCWVFTDVVSVADR